MIIDETNKEKVAEVFKIAYTYKDDAKESNRSANEALKTLAEFLDKEKSKSSLKAMNKAVKRAFKTWEERQKGERYHEDSDVIADSVEKKEEL